MRFGTYASHTSSEGDVSGANTTSLLVWRSALHPELLEVYIEFTTARGLY